MAYEAGMERMVFKPAQDITAYELASILQRVTTLNMSLPMEFIESWPDNLRRHWRLPGTFTSPQRIAQRRSGKG